MATLPKKSHCKGTVDFCLVLTVPEQFSIHLDTYVGIITAFMISYISQTYLALLNSIPFFYQIFIMLPLVFIFDYWKLPDKYSKVHRKNMKVFRFCFFLSYWGFVALIPHVQSHGEDWLFILFILSSHGEKGQYFVI